MIEASGSPAPDAAAPSPAPGYDPQIVGKGFVKAYYNQLLAKDQEKLVNYYVPSPNTYLSHAEGGEKTEPVALEDYKSQLQTTNRWGKADDETMGLVMHAMDIHQTSSDTLLIVVTAVMRFLKSNDSGRSERQKFFVQTFLLARQGGWGVQNDVLRFLDPPVTAAAKEEKTAAASAPTNAQTSSSTGTNTEPASPTKDAAVGTDKKEVEDTAADKASVTANVEEDDAPGGGVEESKEEPPEEADEAESAPAKSPAVEGSTATSETAATKDDKGKASKNKGSKPAPMPTPNSWASLVATGGSAPNTPSRKPAEKPEPPKDATKPPVPSGADKTKDSDKPKAEKPKSKPADQPAAKPASNASTSKSGGAGGGGGGGRGDRKERTFNADCTLVIKNLDKASQEDVIKMFTPFATSTKSKLIGAHVNPFRKLAFVDFDAVAPVMAALKQHTDTPFQWNGQVLEVDQKSAEQRARRDAARGGSYRSGSPSNGARNGGGGGGRGGGRGSRGGGRGGGGSRGGGRGGK
jgi:Nuclear transport factor 2 (NTF2) domain